jgi:hypothetical protein
MTYSRNGISPTSARSESKAEFVGCAAMILLMVIFGGGVTFGVALTLLVQAVA